MEIKVQVKPGSRHDSVEETDDGLLVHLRARAIDGAANKALVEILSKHFAVPKTRISIKRGGSSRHKTILVDRS